MLDTLPVLFPKGSTIRVALNNGAEFIGELIKTDLENDRLILRSDKEIALINLNETQAIVRVLSGQDLATEFLEALDDKKPDDYHVFDEKEQSGFYTRGRIDQTIAEIKDKNWGKAPDYSTYYRSRHTSSNSGKSHSSPESNTAKSEHRSYSMAGQDYIDKKKKWFS